MRRIFDFSLISLFTFLPALVLFVFLLGNFFVVQSSVAKHSGTAYRFPSVEKTGVVTGQFSYATKGGSQEFIVQMGDSQINTDLKTWSSIHVGDTIHVKETVTPFLNFPLKYEIER